jgi:hypothetical protein
MYCQSFHGMVTLTNQLHKLQSLSVTVTLGPACQPSCLLACSHVLCAGCHLWVRLGGEYLDLGGICGGGE